MLLVDISASGAFGTQKQLKQDLMMVPPDTFFMSKIDSLSPNVTDIESPAGIILQTHEDVVL